MNGFRLLSAALLLVASLGYATDRCVQDDNQRTLCFAYPVHKIISLAPNLTELVFAAGAGAYLVGVEANSDYPKKVHTLPSVGRYPHITIERLVQLKPELVLLWDSGGHQSPIMAQLKTLHIPYYVSKITKLDDIPTTLLRLGKLAGTERIARQQAVQWTRKWHHLQQQYAHRAAPIPVFFILSVQPLMSIGGSQFINQVITLCNGKNIFSQKRKPAFSVTQEALLPHPPKVLIAMQSAQKALSHNALAQSYPVIFLPDDWIARNGPRLLKAAEQLCYQLHSLPLKTPKAIL